MYMYITTIKNIESSKSGRKNKHELSGIKGTGIGVDLINYSQNSAGVA